MKKLTLIFWLIFIFIMSSMNSSASYKLSISVVNVIGLNHEYGNLIVRKMAHALEFFILGILIFRITKGNLLSLFIPIVFAFLDEFHQFFVPGRNMFYGDVLIDSTGVICAFLIYKCYYHIFLLNKR